jgi:hypothetical protein
LKLTKLEMLALLSEPGYPILKAIDFIYKLVVTCAHATRQTRDRLAVPLGVPLDHAILLARDR